MHLFVAEWLLPCFCVVQADKILHLLVVKRPGGYGVDPNAWKKHELGKLVFVSLELLIAKLKELKMLGKGLVKAG